MTDKRKPSTFRLEQNLIDLEIVFRDSTDQYLRAAIERGQAERKFINAASSLTIRLLADSNE